MATTTPSQRRKTDYRSREMLDKRELQEWQFTKETPKLEGVYLGAQNLTDITTQYVIQDGEGNRFVFVEPPGLQEFLSPMKVGHWVMVQFKREVPCAETPGVPARLFRVLISKKFDPEFIHAIAQKVEALQSVKKGLATTKAQPPPTCTSSRRIN